MSSPTSDLVSMLRFYRGITVALLLVVLVLGVTMLLTPIPEVPPPTGVGSGPMPGPAGLPSGVPAVAPPAPTLAAATPPTSTEWTVVALNEKIAQLPMLFSDAVAFEEYLQSAPPGSVRVQMLGFGQQDEFAFDRRQTIAYVVFSGAAVLDHVCTGAGLTALEVTAGTLVQVPAYCGHRWRNAGSETFTGLLRFETPSPLDPNVSTRVRTAPDDTRGTLGGAPVVVDLNGEAIAPLLGGRLEAIDVSGVRPVEPSPAPMAIYAARGTVVVVDETQTPRTLTAPAVMIVPAGASVSLTSDTPGTRVLQYDPARDGVHAITRTQPSQFSQGAEERIIRGHFEDARDLVFLDVGSAHPQRISTTYYLEAQLGWSGIAIDAQPEYGPEYATVRPRTRFFSYFVSDTDDLAETLYRDARVPVVASNSREVALEQTEASLGSANIEAVEVRTISLNTLLTREGVDHVDFVSMDIEEHEPEALRGFDLARFRPRLICIEAHGRTQDALYAHFVQNGYRRLDQYLAYDTVNWYFGPNE